MTLSAGDVRPPRKGAIVLVTLNVPMCAVPCCDESVSERYAWALFPSTGLLLPDPLVGTSEMKFEKNVDITNAENS